MAWHPIPSTQRAAIVPKKGRDWTITVDDSFPVPALEPQQAVVRLSHTGVCHSDLSGINGGWNRQSTCQVPGHEGVGRVVAYHPDTDLTSVPPLGTKVGVALIRQPCGTCKTCALPDGEVLCAQTTFHGMQSDGTYQQYVAVYTSYLIPVPETISDSLAAPILCGGVTSYKALKKSGARPGDWVAVAGAGGGLGSFAVQYAVAMGMRVVGIDTGEDKRRKTLQLGAAAFFDYRAEGMADSIVALTGGGAHAVIVLAPAESTYNEALRYVRIQGCIVCVGLPHEDVRLKIAPGFIIHHDITVKGSMVGTRKDITEALEFVARGQVKPEIILYELDDISDIFKQMERNEIIGRAVLKL